LKIFPQWVVFPKNAKIEHNSAMITDRRKFITKRSLYGGLVSIFTARCIASDVLATAVPSVRPSVRPSHAGIASIRRHIARCRLHCHIANVSSFVETKKYSPGLTLSS